MLTCERSIQASSNGDSPSQLTGNTQFSPCASFHCRCHPFAPCSPIFFIPNFLSPVPTNLSFEDLKIRLEHLEKKHRWEYHAFVFDSVLIPTLHPAPHTFGGFCKFTLSKTTCFFVVFSPTNGLGLLIRST